MVPSVSGSVGDGFVVVSSSPDDGFVTMADVGSVVTLVGAVVPLTVTTISAFSQLNTAFDQSSLNVSC